MAEKPYLAAPYVSSSNLSGQTSPFLYRAKNMMLRGTPERMYLECYNGSYDLGETIPDATLTGTISLTAGSKIVTGVGTLFRSELHLGQFVWVNHELLVVDTIDSDLAFTAGNAAYANASGVTAKVPPILFEIDRKRGTLIRGNVLKYDKGTLLGVGDGTLRINGAPTSGTAFVAARNPRLALYAPASGNYSTPFQLGMTTPAAFTTAISGTAGTKAMSIGTYGIAIAPARDETDGFNQLSPITLHASTAVGQRITVHLPAMDTANGQNAWYIYVSLFGAVGTYSGIKTLYQYKKVTATELGGTGAVSYDIEWYDAEVGRNTIAEFDNFPPPQAEFVVNLSGLPFYISCFGDQSGSAQAGKSPGPRVVSSKPNNIEAALLNVKISPSPPETILGAAAGPARIFAWASNGVYSVQSSGRDDAPLVMRPYLKVGCKGVYAATVAQQFLYLFSEAGMVRTTTDAENGVANFDFAIDVAAEQSTWTPGKVFLVHDPLHETVLAFHPANNLNANGYWETVIHQFSLRYEKWFPPIILTSASDDRVVTGAAKVNNKVYFICGGRNSSWKTYEFNRLSGESVPYYATWGYDDSDSAVFEEVIDSFQVTGKFTTGAVLQIHGARASQDLVITNLENGVNSISGDIPLTASSYVRHDQQNEINMPELALIAPRISGTWDGTGIPDRIDKLVLNPTTQPGQR